ncbi:MAG: hypothetical protein ABUL73_04390 [Alphaproteobacteria bacterium]
MRLNFSSDLDAVDHRFIDAFAAVSGESDILVLNTWNGLDKTTWDLPEEDHREAAIYIEWYQRKGRFGLEIDMFGHGMPRGETRAQFTRRLVRALNRPLLVSDCSLFGFSWFKHDPDGAIWEVISNTKDVEDFDLLCDLPPDHADYYPAIPIYGTDEALPPAPPEAEAMKTRYCEQRNADTLHCHHLGGSCPKYPRRAPGSSPATRVP